MKPFTATLDPVTLHHPPKKGGTPLFLKEWVMRLEAPSPLMASLMVCACAGAGGMIPGTIYTSSGKMLHFEIEKAYRTGAVKAVDPTTGEKLAGRYSSVREGVYGTSSAFVSGRNRYASGFGSASATSNIANATAFLKGDRGTTLNCSMVIQAGFSPSGIGECSDNRGKKYRLQF